MKKRITRFKLEEPATEMSVLRENEPDGNWKLYSNGRMERIGSNIDGSIKKSCLLLCFLLCQLSVFPQMKYVFMNKGISKEWAGFPEYISEKEMTDLYRNVRNVSFREEQRKTNNWEIVNVQKHFLDSDRKGLYGNLLSDQELAHLHGIWHLVSTGSNGVKLYLDSLIADDSSIQSENVLKRIEKQYGREKYGIKAEWVNGKFRTVSHQHHYGELSVSRYLRVIDLDHGTVKKEAIMCVDGNYDKEGGRFSAHGGYSTNESGIDIAGTKLALMLLSHDMNQIIPKNKLTGSGRETTDLLLWQNPEGKLSMKMLSEDGLNKEFVQMMDVVAKGVKNLPAWPFCEYFISDGRLLPGRYVTVTFRPNFGLYFSDMIR